MIAARVFGGRLIHVLSVLVRGLAEDYWIFHAGEHDIIMRQRVILGALIARISIFLVVVTLLPVIRISLSFLPLSARLCPPTRNAIPIFQITALFNAAPKFESTT